MLSRYPLKASTARPLVGLSPIQMGSPLTPSSAPNDRRRSGEAHSEMTAISGCSRRSASSLRCSAMLQFQATRRIRACLARRSELDHRAEAMLGGDLQPVAGARGSDAVALEHILGGVEVLDRERITREVRLAEHVAEAKTREALGEARGVEDAERASTKRHPKRALGPSHRIRLDQLAEELGEAARIAR